LVDFRNAILEEIRKDREKQMVDHELINDSIKQFLLMALEKNLVIKKLAG